MTDSKNRKSDELQDKSAVRGADKYAMLKNIGAVVSAGLILGLLTFVITFNSVYAKKVELNRVEEASAKVKDIDRIVSAVEALQSEQKILSKAIADSLKQTSNNKINIENQEKILDRHMRIERRLP